jgi:hypothetical protein
MNNAKGKSTKVVEVKGAPELKAPAMLSGIRDTQGAERWGERYGYATVYFWSSRQRVYAEKLLTHVEEKAEVTV